MSVAAIALSRRLVAAMSGLALVSSAACVPAASAPPAAGEPVPTATTKPVSSPLGPAAKGNPTKEELCAGHTCPSGTYCDSDMTPRGPVAQCKPQITQVPGRAFGAIAGVVGEAWG